MFGLGNFDKCWAMYERSGDNYLLSPKDFPLLEFLLNPELCKYLVEGGLQVKSLLKSGLVLLGTLNLI